MNKIFILIILAISLNGCFDVLSKKPLVPVEDSNVDKKLLGKWILVKEKQDTSVTPDYIEFIHYKKNWINMKQSNIFNFSIITNNVRGNSFINIFMQDESDKKLYGYAFQKYIISGEYLIIQGIPSLNFDENLVPLKHKTITVKDGQKIKLIDDSGEAVANYILKKNYFSTPRIYKKQWKKTNSK